jgi:DNA-binding response OmpR family regulator
VFASAEDLLHTGHLQHTACLLLEMRMPGMSGLERQRHVATAPWRIPIIFLTAHGEEAGRARTMHAGVVGCLHQRFREAALLAAIRAALASDRDGASRPSSWRQSPPCRGPERAGRRARRAASTHHRRCARRQGRDPDPKGAALQVSVWAASVNLVED